MSTMTPVPQNLHEDMRSTIAEALGLTMADVLPQIMNLRVILDSAKIVGVDEFRVDGGFAFIGWEVRPHIAMNEPSKELAGAVGSFLNLRSIKQRTMYKALNATLTLWNPDREGMKVVETDVTNSSGQLATYLAMSSLWPDLGGAPLQFCADGDFMPLFVPQGDRLKLQVNLGIAPIASPANGAEGQTEYGVDIIGAYVRVRDT